MSPAKPRRCVQKGGLLALLGLMTVVATVPAAEPSAHARPAPPIAVIYNANANDLGFNKLILQGVNVFETQRGVKTRVFRHPLNQIFKGSDLEVALSQAVAEGTEALVFGGFATFGDVVAGLAKSHPHTRIVAIDGYLPAEGRVQVISFRYHEAAYLAGIVAGRASRSGVIGFVGGLDIPDIRSFGCAYAQGARDSRPGIEVRSRMIGHSPTAFSDPEGGRRAAGALLAERADVIFAAAGGSGLGALAATVEAGGYGVGVDDNQNGLYPGHILTSVLKRVDVAVYSALVALDTGDWQPGVQSVGLTEGAVGLAMDENNRPLLSEHTLEVLDSAEFAIRAGALQVVDARALAGRCPYLEFTGLEPVVP